MAAVVSEAWLGDSLYDCMFTLFRSSIQSVSEGKDSLWAGILVLHKN